MKVHFFKCILGGFPPYPTEMQQSLFPLDEKKKYPKSYMDVKSHPFG